MERLRDADRLDPDRGYTPGQRGPQEHEGHADPIRSDLE